MAENRSMRERRLAEALRANLRLRKAQVRARDAATPPGPMSEPSRPAEDAPATRDDEADER